MKFQERSYSTKVLRPKPQVHWDEEGGLVVVATSWGQPEHAQRVLEEVVKYVNAAKADVEVTSPFQFLTCLTDEANYVRTAVLIANEALYRGENRNEYFSGVEVLVLFKRGSQLAWAQVGCPSILVQRKNQNLQPLAMGLDLANELRQDTILSPMPAQLLGLDPTCNICCGHTSVASGDQLILLACASVATSLWLKTSEMTDLAEITGKMLREEPESPFWLGLIET